MDRLMTARDAAEYLRMNFQTVYKLAQRGRLPASRVGGQWRFKREILDEWLRLQSRIIPEQRQPRVTSIRSILVIDDDPGVRNTFAEVLGRAGHQVDSAPSGRAGLERVQREHFDLIFLDVLMPGLTGVETLKGLRAIDPKARVVIITGYPEHHLVAEALELGPVVALRKPVKVQDILSTVSLLDGS